MSFSKAMAVLLSGADNHKKRDSATIVRSIVNNLSIQVCKLELDLNSQKTDFESKLDDQKKGLLSRLDNQKRSFDSKLMRELELQKNNQKREFDAKLKRELKLQKNNQNREFDAKLKRELELQKKVFDAKLELQKKESARQIKRMEKVQEFNRSQFLLALQTQGESFCKQIEECGRNLIFQETESTSQQTHSIAEISDIRSSKAFSGRNKSSSF